MFKSVKSFQDLLDTPFAGSTNALCWERTLPGDFAEVVRLLGPGADIVALDEDRLRSLKLTASGLLAVDTMLSDLSLLRDAGRDPVLNIIYGYARDEDGGPVPTDVMSWHVDRAPVEADTWLCTYHGAPSEGLLNAHAHRKVDDPNIRAELLKLYGGPEDESFAEWLTENHYDLHFAPRNALSLSNGLYSFGVGPLWRITVEWPGNSPSSACHATARQSDGGSSMLRPPSSASPPCVHRAPVTDTPRLLLIS